MSSCLIALFSSSRNTPPNRFHPLTTHSAIECLTRSPPILPSSSGFIRQPCRNKTEDSLQMVDINTSISSNNSSSLTMTRPIPTFSSSSTEAILTSNSTNNRLFQQLYHFNHCLMLLPRTMQIVKDSNSNIIKQPHIQDRSSLARCLSLYNLKSNPDLVLLLVANTHFL